MRTPLPPGRLSRWLAGAALALLATPAAWAQSTANYAFAASTTSSLADMSSNTTDALATGTYRDDDASAVQPLGFTFAFMGTAYTQFSVNSNGQLQLGTTAITGTNVTPAANTAILAPLGGDNAIQAAGKVHYKVLPGTNRTLVVEWSSLRIPFSSTAATGSVVQALLEENTGKIEYRYGTVYNNSTTATTRTIFLSSGTAAGQIGQVRTFTTTPTYDAAATSLATSSLPASAAAPGLSSTADGSRTAFSFTPVSGAPGADPTVALTSVGQASLNVVVTDNSTNETYFTVSRSTDNTTFTTVGTLATSSSSGTGTTLTLAQTGLTPGTTYYYRVTANNEGGGTSGAGTASATTVAAVPVCGTKTVGPNGDYATLTAAFAAVGINGLCGPLVLELQASYVSTTETFPLVYSYAGGSATNTVTLRPAAGATGLLISSSATQTLAISGGRYLLIDGRPGGTGGSIGTNLTIANTSTSGTAVQFTADATFNTVQYSQLRGVGTTLAAAVVNFSGTATTGNSDNSLLNNNLSDGATTPLTLVYSASSLNSRNTISGNNLFNFYGSGTAAGVYLSTAGSGWTITGNSFYQTASRTGVASTTLYGIYAGSGNGHSITGNFIGGTAPSAGGTPLTISGTAASYRFQGIFLSTSGAAPSVQGNTIANISWLSTSGASTGAGILAGIYVSSGDANIGTVTGNVIGTANGPITVSSSTTGGYVFGISQNASSSTVSISRNVVSNLTTTSTATNIAGIFLSAGTANTVSLNKIYGLTTGAGASITTGIWSSAGTTNTLVNNLVGDLRTTASTSLVGISGIQVSGGTTANVYYNSLYLNATSTGATFGTSGIYLNSTSTALDARNNVVVNKSTAAGTGGYTAALRRVSGTAGTVPANLASTTNNNLYYAGTPSATNLIYVEGTTTATNAQQTLAAYKAFVASRESASVTEDVAFLSTTGTDATFLHVNATTPTQIEASGTPISGITTDFDGDTRSTTTPDLGADEGSFTPQDLTGPTITYTALGNTTSTANRTLAVTITDASGIGTGANAPRLYYRKGASGAYTSTTATSVSGDVYTFTFDFAALGGVAGTDLVQYYVAAQDNAPAQNPSSSPVGASGNNPPGTTFAGTPNQFFIQGALSGTYYVGTGTSPVPGRTYPTLTTAAAAYNANSLGGAVTFVLLDATYGPGETFPVAFSANADASATNTLTIKPNTGATTSITGSASALLQFNGTDYVTVDGSANGTTTRDLTLTNTSTGASAVVWVGSLGDAAGATNITLKNLNVVGGSATNTTSFGIYAAGSTLSTSGTGADNDNLVIQNNVISTAYEAIYARGTSAGLLDGLQIVGNQIGGSTAATTVTFRGVDVVAAAAPQISQNRVVGMQTSGSISIAAIDLGANVANAVVSRNYISNLRSTSTSGYGAYGVHISSTTGTSGNEISNNMISDVLTDGDGTSTQFNAFGIRLAGGTGTKVYYNSVNLTGPLTNVTTSDLSAALVVTTSSVTGLDLRNNVLANAITGGTGTKSYALYVSSAASVGTFNHNDYYVSGANGVLAYVAADRATLADVRTATTQDANSVSANPMFTSATDLHVTNAIDLNNTGTPVAVTVDFDGDARSATTPDIGADEFALPQTADLAPVALLSPAVSSSCYSPAEAVTVSIRSVSGATLNFATAPATVTVVVTPPSGTAQTFTTTVSTGTLASGATQAVTLPGTLDMTAPGTYSFVVSTTLQGDINTANDVLTPAPTRTVTAPTAGTLVTGTTAICVSGTASLTLTGSANGNIQLQQSTDNVTFTNISGATAATFTTPVLTQTTYFRALTTCNTTVATSNVVTVTVNNPQVTITNSPVAVCEGSTATLTATAGTGTTVRFFDAATGGTALATGTSFTTPALTTSRQYFVEAVSGGSETAGRTAPTGTSSTTASNYGLVFTASSNIRLTSVDVYPAGAAGNLVVEVQDNTGTLIPGLTATVAIPAGTGTTAFTVPLNFNIPAGTGLRLIAVSSPSMVRESSVGGFPYTSPSGNVSITNGYISGTSTTYYFFYNWQVSTECAGTRTPIQVNVTPAPTATLPATASTCGTSAYQLTGTVGGSATGGTYATSGTGTFSPNATTLNATYMPSAADVAAGTVTLTLTTTGPAVCTTTTAQVTLSISPAPVATFSYANASYCAGATGTASPVLGAGATAGTFSASGTGLVLDPFSGIINLATSTAGTYTVTNTVAASGACAAATATFSVTISARPAQPTVSVQYNGATTTLTSSSATGNQWYLGTTPVTGATGQTYVVNTPGQYGSYTVVVTNAAGCASLPSAPLIVNSSRQPLAGSSLRIYPNPTTDGQVRVELTGYTKATTLNVLNAIGQQVQQVQLAGQAGVREASLDLTQLPAGVYILQTRTEGGLDVRRIVKQ